MRHVNRTLNASAHTHTHTREKSTYPAPPDAHAHTHTFYTLWKIRFCEANFDLNSIEARENKTNRFTRTRIHTHEVTNSQKNNNNKQQQPTETY